MEIPDDRSTLCRARGTQGPAITSVSIVDNGDLANDMYEPAQSQSRPWFSY